MKEIVLREAPDVVVREILQEEKMTVKQMADKMGVSRQSANQSLNVNTKSMRCDTFRKMIEACGYEVIVRKIG